MDATHATAVPPPARPTGQRRLDDWQARLDHIVQTMREVSRSTDPQEMVRAYGMRVRMLSKTDRFVALSRRNLPRPQVRITRSDLWTDSVNPWKEPQKLPLIQGGLLSELIWGDEPVIIDDLSGRLASDDPAGEYFRGMRSLVAIPNYDRGEALNMVVWMFKRRAGFSRRRLPETVWMANLFGRATHNLVLAGQLKEAYEALDRELQAVADIQRSLLPAQLPKVPALDLAAHYQTSRRAGGDYYDLFPLPDGRLGILIADVSGHGTPAAVLMAVTHSIAHTHPELPDPPSRLLEFLNHHLATRYTNGSGNFVTAFYAIFDPKTCRLTYSSAGHNPPRVKRCRDGSVFTLDGARGFPLGIVSHDASSLPAGSLPAGSLPAGSLPAGSLPGDSLYTDATHDLLPGDSIVFFTDGITEARAPDGELFGNERLDAAIESCRPSSDELLARLLSDLDRFTAGAAPTDDRTILIARITGACDGTTSCTPGAKG